MKNSIPQRHVQHAGIRQWIRSRAEATGQAFPGIFPGIFPAHSQGAWAGSQLVPSGSAKQGLGTRTSCFHQGQLQPTIRGQSCGLQPKFQSLLSCNSHLWFPAWKAQDRPWRQVPRGCCQPGGRLPSGFVCLEMVSVAFPLAFQPQSPALHSPGEERTRVIAQLNVASIPRFFRGGSSSQWFPED